MNNTLNLDNIRLIIREELDRKDYDDMEFELLRRRNKELRSLLHEVCPIGIQRVYNDLDQRIRLALMEN